MSTKTDLAKLLSQRLPLNAAECEDFIEAFYNVLAEELIRGEKVRIGEIGSLSMRLLEERQRRNPMTGETFLAPAKWILKFKEGHVFMSTLNLSTRK